MNNQQYCCYSASIIVIRHETTTKSEPGESTGQFSSPQRSMLAISRFQQRRTLAAVCIAKHRGVQLYFRPAIKVQQQLATRPCCVRAVLYSTAALAACIEMEYARAYFCLKRVHLGSLLRRVREKVYESSRLVFLLSGRGACREERGDFSSSFPIFELKRRSHADLRTFLVAGDAAAATTSSMNDPKLERMQIGREAFPFGFAL
ncbi:hypothetical protein SCHPADRAFT_476224 [Schizopora paradoxa]|uniref:Uncharacterized protein n=1 Tax=Schizopora paradoxa TaxID=27342 RepID=A0A0H2RHC1_9AGAM|nr:hypothetical protein SCHPADRAFT_476224 [Schizopora paradoxa]